MSEELTACRVAVENCEMFRARIADLEHRCGMYGLELTNEVERRLQAERQLSAIKAQEPVAWEVYYADDDSFHTITRNKMLIDGYSSMAYVIKPLYAAPVSEAKAIIDGLRGEVAQLQRAEKNDSIAYKAALERQDELREEISDMHRKLDKFYRKSHGVPALAEIERLSEDRDQQAQRIGELASHLEFAVTLLTVAGLAGNAQVEAMRAALSASVGRVK